MAFNWAYKKGFKNVIIAGIDLTEENQHFDYATTPDQDGHTFRNGTIINARKHLKEVAQKYLNIYQLNPDNDMDLPKINITDLL